MDYEQDRSRTITPPHHPTYRVQASEPEILHILNHAIPHAELVSSAALPHGQSYNNRIYNLSVSLSGNAGSEASVQALILKVGGRFWKTIKTRNEVMCLRLIKLYCPQIPVPEVLAWSNRSGEIVGVDFEWILMTKLTGTGFQPDELNAEDREEVAADLARYIYLLRTKVPSPGEIGNLVDIDANSLVKLGGLVDAPGARGWPYKSYLNYKQAVLTHNIELLEQSEEFRPNRYLVTQSTKTYQAPLTLNAGSIPPAIPADHPSRPPPLPRPAALLPRLHALRSLLPQHPRFPPRLSPRLQPFHLRPRRLGIFRILLPARRVSPGRRRHRRLCQRPAARG